MILRLRVHVVCIATSHVLMAWCLINHRENFALFTFVFTVTSQCSVSNVHSNIKAYYSDIKFLLRTIGMNS